jgi:hypothetical protein
MAKYISGRGDTNSLKQWAKYSRKNSYHNKSDSAASGKGDETPHKYHEPRHGAGTGLGRIELGKIQSQRKPKI